MKNKVLILLMLTVVNLAPIQAITKDQTGVAMTKEDQKVFDRLFKAIDDVNVDDVQMILKENEHIRSFLSTHRHKGLTVLDKLNEKLNENKESALSRGEKAAVTKKLHKIEKMIKGEEVAPKVRRSRCPKAEKSLDIPASPVMK
jgi:hypothetical protein